MNNKNSWWGIAKKWLFATACILCLTTCDHAKQQLETAKPDTTPAETENVLSRALYSAYLQLDPQFAKVVADAAPIRDLFVGLVKFDTKGKIIPAVAKEWFSEDYKEWLFILNENARWSNGKPVTADDFVASWQRLSDPHNASPLAPYLIYMGVENAKAIALGEKPVETLAVKALNPHSLQISLTKANPQFPQMLAHSALLPSYQGKKPNQTGEIVTNGDYQVLNVTQTTLQLKAREPQTPFQQVSYQLITSDQSTTGFDLIENPLAKGQNLVLFPRLCSYFYEFNFNDPLLAKREVRQAIRAMISSEEISQGVGIPLYFAIPKTLFVAQERQLTNVSAETLLSKLGVHSGNPLTLTLVYDSQGLHPHIANRIARTLAQSDLFRLRLIPVEWKHLLSKRTNKDFQLIRSGWCADYPDPLQFLMPFHSASPDNKSGYHNEKVDQALEQLQRPQTAEKKAELMSSVVHQLEQDVAILPLFQYQRALMISPDIRGYDVQNASEVIYSKDLFRQQEGKQQ